MTYQILRLATLINAIILLSLSTINGQSLPGEPAVYIKQHQGEVLRFEDTSTSLDPAIVLSGIALLISCLAIYLPLKVSKEADKKATFFRLYERWNSEYMIKARDSFWQILAVHGSPHSKVSLKKLYDTNKSDYYVYEAIYDTLKDLAKLYYGKHVNKKLVKSLISNYIDSYGLALVNEIEFYESQNRLFGAMGAKYYKLVLRLRKSICDQPDKPGTYASPAEK